MKKSSKLKISSNISFECSRSGLLNGLMIYNENSVQESFSIGIYDNKADVSFVKKRRRT